MKKIACLSLAVFSLLLLFSCHREQNEIEISRIIEIQENAIDILNDLSVSGQSGETIINNCIQQLLSNPEVVSAYVQDYDQIVIRYKSGITSVILLIDETEEQEKSTPQSIKFNNKGLDDEVQITNHKVLIWDWAGDPAYAAGQNTDLQNVFENCSDVDFDVVVKQFFDCTLQSLYDLTQYGYVYIHTHGGIYKNSHGEEVCWILTRQLANSSQISDEDITSERKILVTTAGVAKEYINNQEIRKFTKDGNYWAVSNKFISKYVTGTFDSPSVVFISACHTFDNSSLRDVFINEKNASFYLGFTHSVMIPFAKKKAIEFATNMVQHRLSAKDAYEAIDVKEDDERRTLLEWYFDCYIFGEHAYDHNYILPPRAMLMCSRKEDPTYFTEEDDSSLGQLICDDGRTYPLHSCHYSPGGSLTFLHSNAESEPSYVMAFYSLTMCNTELGNFHPLQPSSTNEWMNLNSNDPWGFWVKNSCSDVSSRLSIAGGGSIKMTDGEVLYNSATGFSFWFIDETGHRWNGSYNGPIS